MQELSAEKTKTLERNHGASHDSLLRCAVANQGKKSEGGTKKRNFKGCADTREEDADYRKFMLENSRRYETMES